MKITREEGQINWEGENCSGAIFQIGIETEDDAAKLFQSWVDWCTAHAKAAPHTVEDGIRFVRERWDVLPLDERHHKMREAHAGFVAQYRPDLLTHEPGEFSFDLSDEGIEHWIKESDARQEEAAGITPEQSGLRLRGFVLPPLGRNLPLMEEGLRVFEQQMRDNPPPPPPGMPDEPFEIQPAGPEPCYLFFEEEHGEMNAQGGLGAEMLMAKVSAYMGCTQEDIDTRSGRFMVYIHSGPDGLPTFDEFKSDPQKYTAK